MIDAFNNARHAKRVRERTARFIFREWSTLVDHVKTRNRVKLSNSCSPCNIPNSSIQYRESVVPGGWECVVNSTLAMKATGPKPYEMIYRALNFSADEFVCITYVLSCLRTVNSADFSDTILPRLSRRWYKMRVSSCTFARSRYYLYFFSRLLYTWRFYKLVNSLFLCSDN